MTQFILTPDEFRTSSVEEQQAAYERLFEHWLNKGEKKNALATELRGISDQWSEGAEQTNAPTEPIRQFIFKFYWLHMHMGFKKVSAKALDKAQSATFPEHRLEKATVGHWLRALNNTWKQGGWDSSDESFSEFDTRVRDFRSMRVRSRRNNG